ncbi:hypothetical protein [Fictibacillus fluitans]|uniref:Uncharacterized protein n=1 Tax=Fictibacillus fluitans TaxID=3058422 RepID=A0ABT8HS28_9BACL|nr:hypothetical protein [Fictibacillus sp. NE201]MDN4523566.1 hypothetical protein [Fictibacillus sp. NE201]
MTLQDALYNWLSIKKVAEERPEDQAAKETLQFFDEILREDHHVLNLSVNLQEENYEVGFMIETTRHKTSFPRDYIDALWESIEAEPKYN